jgi:hypothetical protein
MLTEEIQFIDALLLEILSKKGGSALRGAAIPRPDRGLAWELGSRLRAFPAARLVPLSNLGTFTTGCRTLYAWNKGSAEGFSRLWNALEEIKIGIDAAIAAPAAPKITRFPSVEADLADALERDLVEAEADADHGHWKSCVVLCGSILEAVLYEYLRRDATWTMSQSGHIPGKKGGGQRQITSDLEEDSWKLVELIKFSCAHGVLGSKWKDALDLFLREPRNLIHPIAAERTKAKVDGETARLSLAALKALLKELYSREEPWKP